MGLRPVIKNYGTNISEKSHKEGPTTVGGSIMGLRPVIKILRKMV